MPEPRHKFFAEICSPPQNLLDNALMKTKGTEMTGKDGDKALRRIILMLLSLASLAERASRAPWPIRCLVLLFLRPAEAKAHGFVREMVETPIPIAGLSAFPADNSPAGALHLAMCFRAMAAVLGLLLEESPRFMREIRQAHSNRDARLGMRRLNGKASVGLPGSRAPPSVFRAEQSEIYDNLWTGGANFWNIHAI